MIVLDANVWISSLIVVEIHHHASDAWLSSWMAAARRIVVPDLFMAEVPGAVARRRSDPVIGAETLRALRRNPLIDIVPLTPAAWRSAAELAAQHLLRGADAVYVALALQETMPLVTWDRTVLSNAAGVIDVRTPDQVRI